MRKLDFIAPSVLLASAMLTISGAALAQEEIDGTTDVIVIRGANIPDEKKSTSEISNILNAEALERQGDTDIAGALRRVTGLSIEGGKFVIVRGLNSRYSSATMNGNPIPSPEPLKRTAPLDLFPTSVLEGTLVQKTFSPQFSGEFGGGLVELRAKSVPNEDFLEIGVGFSGNTVTSINDGLFYEGSDTDIFGYDDGLRELPSEVSSFLDSNPGERTLSVDARTSFDQFDTLLINSDGTPLNGNGSVAFGKVFETDGDVEFGTTFYVGYGNEWQTKEGRRERPETFSAGVFQNPDEEVADYKSTTQDITVSALSSTGVEWGDNAIDLTGLVVRKTSKEAQISEGTADQENDFFRSENTNFIERQIWQTMLNGEHEFYDFGELEVDWRVAYGKGERDAPYERGTQFRKLNEDATDYFFNANDNGNSIAFSEIDDTNGSAGIDFLLPLEFGDAPVDLIFGAAYSVNSREAERREFNIRGSFPSEVLGSRADLIFSDEILSLTGPVVNLQSTRNQPDNFDGLLQVSGAYAGIDAELGEFFRLALGARYEESKQKTETDVTVLDDGRQVFPTLADDFVLPAVTLTWIPAGNFQLRGGYSETITRPQFRELTAVRFNDPETDLSYIGNPFLVNAEIKNYDARAEWYFNRGEFATIGVFYKDMQKPIEDIIRTAGNDPFISFVNAPAAELYGIELEFEKNFALDDFFGDDWYGKDLVFKTNYTWSQSEVDNNGDVIVSNVSNQGTTDSTEPAAGYITAGSPLVGQSDHLFNLQLGLEDADTGFQGTFLLNYSSDRILYRGESTSSGPLPPVYEAVPVTLDFVVNQDLDILGGDVTLSVKLQNIFDSNYKAYVENGPEDNYINTEDQYVSEFDFEAYDLGRTFSVSLKKAF